MITEDYFGPRRLGDIKTADIEDFIGELRKPRKFQESFKIDPHAEASDPTRPSANSDAIAKDDKDLEDWLAFVGTYRTLCLAPTPEFRRMLTTIPQAPAAA